MLASFPGFRLLLAVTIFTSKLQTMMRKSLKAKIDECAQDLISMSQMNEFAWGLACGLCLVVMLLMGGYLVAVRNPTILRTIPGQETPESLLL